MANQACGAEDPAGAEPLPGLPDAQLLKAAMHEAISTSPDAFLTTTSELKARDADYWEREIRSFTWAVIQRGADVVGFAVAKWPDGDMDRDVDPVAARFIESVWIHPKLRGKRRAERLMRFLFEVELAKSPGIERFLLWVFDKNEYAIRLYKRIGFKRVAKQEVPDGSGRIELCFEYWMKPDSPGVQAARADRQDDLHAHGLVYRVLGEGAW
jgi:ribosomal protein S18 acetylase RimI-like enzyme